MAICLYCEKEFQPIAANVKKGMGKYCSRECGYASKRRVLLCSLCGKEFSRRKSYTPKSKTVFCSADCRTKSMLSRKFLGLVDGYRVYERSNGYASIVLGRSKEKLLHVYFMEKHLNRSLVKNEHVHHINQNKLDNRLENLQLVSDCGGHQREHAYERLRALGGTPGVHKYCPSCDEVLPLELFPNAKSTYDGKYGFCKACSCARVRAYVKANKSKVIARRKELYKIRRKEEV